MTRMSLSVCAAAAIFLVGTAVADEAKSGIEQTATLKLARTAFPLPEQATFEAELALLSDVLLAKVQHPAPAQFAHDRVFGHELVGVFRLMRQWPIEKFREPIMQQFKTSDDFVIECARVLVAYRDEDLRELVKTRSEYSRTTIRSGQRQNPKTETVLYILKTKLSPEEKFHHFDSLLPTPLEWVGLPEFHWPDGMTIQRAVSLLSDEDPSVRLQSWVWLGERGIIAPTDVVSEHWPKLTERQQELISRLKPRFLGQSRMLKLFWELTGNASARVRTLLLTGQAELGSQAAIVEARRQFSSMIKEEYLEIFCADPKHFVVPELRPIVAPSDTSNLIKLHRCQNQWFAQLAINALCSLDHPDAIKEVGEALLKPGWDWRRKYDWRDRCVCDRLQEQSVKGLMNRNLYLDVLANALRKHTGRFETPHLTKLVETFECMTGQDFTSDVLLNRKKVRRTQFSIVWSANGKRTSSVKTIEEYQDLAVQTAEECLSWYSKQLAKKIEVRIGMSDN